MTKQESTKKGQHNSIPMVINCNYTIKPQID